MLEFSSIDIYTPRFIQQKLNYIHLNPIRAKLCAHPAEWKWSSYRAYLPHRDGDVPIEVDWRGLWDFATPDQPAGNARR